MAMGSQFSLSLELTKLVPFGSLVNAAGQGFVRLLREIQASGSDFIAEEDLAQVFGRNRIEPLFASTFRTAVKHSVIHEISSIAEIVFEGGAGPTVRRSLNEPAYFAMVVQLSVLTFTHGMVCKLAAGVADMLIPKFPPELLSLTKSLTRAFERRSQGATDYVAPPRYDALKGALRAIREQTCGFMWELVLSAVEKRLYPSIGWTDGGLYILRTIPTVILQGLLDSLSAIQHLPENTYLRISTMTGIPTIVVWAHQILGLTVKVDFHGQSLIFGNGQVSIYIDGDTRGSQPEIVLLNETDDPFFRLAGTDADDRLLPVRQHPLKDYGTQVIRLQDDSEDRERKLVHDTVTSCISIAQDQNKHRLHGAPKPEQQQYRDLRELSRLSCFPSVSRVLAVSKMLFASNEDVIDAIDLDSEMPCAAREADRWSTQLLLLTHVVLVLGMVHGLDEQLVLHLNVLDREQYQPFRVPDARVAYSSLATLLEGQLAHRPTNMEIGRTSVVSASGWSLCLSSLASKDPSDAKGLLAFIRGVPARAGERRRYVRDSVPPRKGIGLPVNSSEDSKFVLASGPGEKCILESRTSSQPARYFVGTTDDAFEVLHLLSCKPPKTDDKNVQVDLSTGYRSMQEASWEVIHIPACNHPSALGQSVILPEGVWAFHGFYTPLYEGFPTEAVFAGLVAGDSGARWTLIDGMLNNWHGPRIIRPPVVCVRGRDCCFECSIQFAKNRQQGSWVGLVL
ncbi:MAG: hypothetical protein Q9221_008761 [Calogaya cf. arnoldii]